MKRLLAAGVVVAMALMHGATLRGDDADRLLSVDHYVTTKSTVPAIAGQLTQLYLREKALAGTVLRSGSLADRVVLFVHGAGTPAEVAVRRAVRRTTAGWRFWRAPDSTCSRWT